DFMTQLREIAPTLLTTPGGAQALSELAPLLSQRAQNKGFREFYEGEKAKELASQQPQPSVQPSLLNQPQKPQAPSPEDYYRNPSAYASPESLYPERANEPQESPEMSAAQQRMKALELMNQAEKMGKPISFGEAQQSIAQQNALIQQQNQRIRAEKDKQ